MLSVFDWSKSGSSEDSCRHLHLAQFSFVTLHIQTVKCLCHPTTFRELPSAVLHQSYPYRTAKWELHSSSACVIKSCVVGRIIVLRAAGLAAVST